ncbi:MAG: cytidylate kinase-like family protein [Clostridia bacterium]|nr:cytidylate kinase-like family protein [Clostridia bacterium]
MNRIITIGRQFATLGSDIGAKLSELTGIKCYDREALVKMAEKHGIPAETFERADEQATSSFLYSLAISSYSGNMVHYGINDNILTDRVFNIQSTEMKKIAEKDDGIFIGRCADDVLSDCKGILRIFIHAPLEFRVNTLVEKYGMEENAARKKISKEDKKRASYYNFYTGKGWGDPKNYHINIDSSLLGVDGTAKMLKFIIDEYYK